MSDVDFAIVVVAYDGREGKHENKDSHYRGSPATKLHCKVMLNEGDTGEAGGCIVTGDQYDERGCGTYEEGIYEYAEGLDETLFNRMAYISGSGSVRYGTFTGFVGEQATFDTVHDSSTEETAGSGVKGKGFCENCINYTR